MSLDIAAVRPALAACLANLGFNVYDYDPEEIPTVDAAAVGLPAEIDYQTTMSGADSTLTLPVIFYFGTAGEQAAHRRMDAALSWKSGATVYEFQAATKALNSASGPWRAAFVQRAENVRRIPAGGGHILAVDVIVTVRS